MKMKKALMSLAALAALGAGCCGAPAEAPVEEEVTEAKATPRNTTYAHNPIYQAPVEREGWEELHIVGRITYKIFIENPSRVVQSDETYVVSHSLDLNVKTDEGAVYDDILFDHVLIETTDKLKYSSEPLSDLERLQTDWLRGPPRDSTVPPSVVEMVLVKDPHQYGRYWVQSITNIVNNCSEDKSTETCLDWSD